MMMKKKMMMMMVYICQACSLILVVCVGEAVVMSDTNLAGQRNSVWEHSNVVV